MNPLKSLPSATAALTIGLAWLAPAPSADAATPPITVTDDNVVVSLTGELWSAEDGNSNSRLARRLDTPHLDKLLSGPKSVGTHVATTRNYYSIDNSGNVILAARANVNARHVGDHVAGLQFLQTNDQIALAWHHPRNRVITWTVLRDGVQIGTSSTGHFTDAHPLSTPTQYTVVGTFTPTDDDLQKAKSSDPQGLTTSFHYTTHVSPFRARMAGMGDPRMREIPLNQLATPRTARSYDARFQWRAFIPFDYVPQPDICLPKVSNSKWDNGNHRYFTDNQDENVFRNSKLSQEIHYTVSPESISFHSRPWVGPTYVYDKDFNFLAPLQANLIGGTSSSGSFPYPEPGSHYSHGTVTIEAGNPACRGAENLGRIQVESQFDVTPDGEVSIFGNHTSAPSHEVTLRTGERDFPLYRFASRAFTGLPLGMRVETFGTWSIDSLPTSAPVTGSQITNRWNEVESILRTPTTEERCGLINDGCYQGFLDGMMYSSTYTRTSWIRGEILRHWAWMNYERSILGYPISDEFCGLRNGGCGQHFEHDGSIYWSPVSGAFETHGSVRAKYASMGWENGEAGYPTSDVFLLPGSGGQLPVGSGQRFQGGLILSKTTIGAHFIKGSILERYAQLQWENGWLGYPTSDEIPTPEGVIQYFEHGQMRFIRATGAVIAE